MFVTSRAHLKLNIRDLLITNLALCYSKYRFIRIPKIPSQTIKSISTMSVIGIHMINVKHRMYGTYSIKIRKQQEILSNDAGSTSCKCCLAYSAVKISNKYCCSLLMLDVSDPPTNQRKPVNRVFWAATWTSSIHTGTGICLQGETWGASPIVFMTYTLAAWFQLWAILQAKSNGSYKCLLHIELRSNLINLKDEVKVPSSSHLKKTISTNWKIIQPEEKS